jgi:hypothetical protein
MAPAVVAALIAGGVQLASGIIQTTQGKKRAKRNARPELGNEVTTDYGNLLDLFEQQATYGVEPSTLNFISGKNEDALQSTLESMLLAGGSPNAVSNAYRGFTTSMSDLGVAETERRWEKIKTLAPITEQLADAKLQKFLYDKDAPYKDEAQAAALQQQMGYQQFMQGLDTLASTAINVEAGKTFGQTEEERTAAAKQKADLQREKVASREKVSLERIAAQERARKARYESRNQRATGYNQ